jgi:hypothetical protein
VEKPSTCARCGGALTQPDTGRPRVYCSTACRRDVEYELRRVSALLLTAEKSEQRSRLAAASEPGTWAASASSAWAGEVDALRQRLRVLLADAAAEEAT